MMQEMVGLMKLFNRVYGPGWFGRWLLAIDPRKREIIKQRYFGNLTYKQCAEIHHVSIERIRQIEAKAIKHLGRSGINIKIGPRA